MSCKWRGSARKRLQLSLYGCLVFSSYVRQLIVPFLNRGSGKTPFLLPIGTSLRRAADTVNFVEPPLCVHSFSTTRLDDLSFVENIF